MFKLTDSDELMYRKWENQLKFKKNVLSNFRRVFTLFKVSEVDFKITFKEFYFADSQCERLHICFHHKKTDVTVMIDCSVQFENNIITKSTFDIKTNKYGIWSKTISDANFNKIKDGKEHGLKYLENDLVNWMENTSLYKVTRFVLFLEQKQR